MPVLLLLEPGVVIYRNVIFPSPPPHLCQRPRDSKYQFTAAPGHIVMSLYTLLPINHAQASGLAGSRFLFGNLVRKREVTDFLLLR